MSGLTGRHSAAASALEQAFKKRTISRAKRSAAMPGLALGRFGVLFDPSIDREDIAVIEHIGWSKANR
jgi:hypothetical protein